jgi:hypothetical protein
LTGLEQEREREQGRDLRKRKQGLEAGVFNIPLLLAIETNSQLEIGIGGSACSYIQKGKEQLHLTVDRGCNRCWCIHCVSSVHSKETYSECGMRR